MDIKSISKKKDWFIKIRLIDIFLILATILVLISNVQRLGWNLDVTKSLVNVNSRYEAYKTIIFSSVKELEQREVTYNTSGFSDSFKNGEVKIKSILDDVGSIKNSQNKLKLINVLQKSYSDMPGLIIFDKTNNVIVSNEGYILSNIGKNDFPISEAENEKNIENNGMKANTNNNEAKASEYYNKGDLLSFSRQIDKNKMDKILNNFKSVGDNFVDKTISIKTSDADYHVIMFKQKNYQRYDITGTKNRFIKITKNIVICSIILILLVIKILYNFIKFKFNGIKSQLKEDFVLRKINSIIKRYKYLCAYSRRYKYLLNTNLISIILFFIYTYLNFHDYGDRELLVLMGIMGMLVAIFIHNIIIINIEIAVDDIDKGNFSSMRNKKGYGYKRIYSKLANINEDYDKALNESLKNERLKTELITNVSHDLKTPLTSIINYVDILKRPEITEEERKEYLDILDNKTNRLKNLIFDLFEVSKLSSGKIVLQKNFVDIIELLNQSLGECSTFYKEKSIEIRFNSNITKLLINVDAEKMARVFENLIINAYKYSLDNTRIYIDVVETTEYAVISLKNISCYEMNFNSQEVFERFVRGDKTRNSKIEGSGLGMAIAKSIVELHDGKMKVDIDGDMFKVYIYLFKEK